MQILDRDRAAALADEVIATNPEFTQYLCRYVMHGAPYCIVAQVLHRFGVPVAVLVALDKGLQGAASIGIRSIHAQGILKDHGFALTDDARRYLALIQDKADDHNPWRTLPALVADYAV